MAAATHGRGAGGKHPLLPLLLLQLLALAPARADPSALWPKPTRLDFTATACGQPVSLAGAALDVTVLVGDSPAARAYIASAMAQAQPEWGCSGAAAGSGAALPLVITVFNGSCTSSACYTAATDESYIIQASAAGVTITAQTLVGVQWALASLASLADGACALDCLPLAIEDAPRFPHRGLMLDTARHFFPPEDIKRKVLDPMHASKMNVLHWHISDAQSQPMEVRFNPALTVPYSPEQVYTQAAVADLVEYAWKRGIRILPEIDMPGHTAALHQAYPELIACYNHLPWDGLGWGVNAGVFCNQPPCGQLALGAEGQAVAAALLSELMPQFPGKLFSTGADEVNFNCYEGRVVPQNSSEWPAFQQAWMAKLAGFQTAVARTLAGCGRRLVVWDESFTQFGFSGTAALPQGSVLVAWEAPELAPNMTAAGYDVIYAPYRNWYLDCGIGTNESAQTSWCAPLNNWTMVYTIDPLEHFGPGSGGDPARVLGGEVPMWTEHVVPAVLDYTLWPRAAAAGERLWSRREDTQDLADAAARLERFSRQLAARGLRVSPLDWRGDNFRYALQTAWCDTQQQSVVDHTGADYCAAAATYRGVPLTFDNLVIAA